MVRIRGKPVRVEPMAKTFACPNCICCPCPFIKLADPDGQFPDSVQNTASASTTATINVTFKVLGTNMMNALWVKIDTAGGVSVTDSNLNAWALTFDVTNPVTGRRLLGFHLTDTNLDAGDTITITHPASSNIGAQLHWIDYADGLDAAVTFSIDGTTTRKVIANESRPSETGLQIGILYGAGVGAYPFTAGVHTPRLISSRGVNGCHFVNDTTQAADNTYLCVNVVYRQKTDDLCMPGCNRRWPPLLFYTIAHTAHGPEGDGPGCLDEATGTLYASSTNALSSDAPPGNGCCHWWELHRDGEGEVIGSTTACIGHNVLDPCGPSNNNILLRIFVANGLVCGLTPPICPGIPQCCEDCGFVYVDMSTALRGTPTTGCQITGQADSSSCSGCCGGAIELEYTANDINCGTSFGDDDFTITITE